MAMVESCVLLPPGKTFLSSTSLSGERRSLRAQHRVDAILEAEQEFFVAAYRRRDREVQHAGLVDGRAAVRRETRAVRLSLKYSMRSPRLNASMV